MTIAPANKLTPTPAMLEQLYTFTEQGMKRVEVAKEMGVSSMTLARWIIGDEFPEIKTQYLAAKQVWAHDLADDITRQASAPLHDDPKLANAEVSRRRLIVETSKWVSSKLLPKVYGDNLVIDHKHSGEVVMSPLAQLRQLEHGGPVVIEAVVIDEVTEDDCF